jgi:lipopolysaccharide export system protein LptC
MVNSLEPAAGVRPTLTGRDRGAAFAEAARHSARVRRIRIIIISGCALAAAGLVARAFFDPFSSLPGNISLASATFNGTRVTMERPKLTGYRQDGRPYDVRATDGVQDIRAPNIIELNQLEAKFETASHALVRVVARRGVYDSGKDFIHMTDDVHVTSDSGYEIRMKVADVDFKGGRIVSNEPVSVVMASGVINANTLDAVDNGEHILFDGNVRTLFHGSNDGETAAETHP